jgi:hypothetical protein
MTSSTAGAPTTEPPPPFHLYERTGTWDQWQGSPTQIGRLAQRGDTWMKQYFGHLRDHHVRGEYTVATERWAGGADNPTDLVGQIDARRPDIQTVSIRARAFPADVFIAPWPIDNGKYTRISGSTPAEGVVSVTAPMLVDLEFRRRRPAVRMRVIAPTEMMCNDLFDHMAAHVDAGTRSSRARESAPVIGIAVGVWAPVPLLFAGVLTDWTLLFQAVAGTICWATATSLIAWAFPPLELVEPWEQSRWRRAKTRMWQLLLFGLAVAGVVITVVLAAPSH